MKTFLIVVILLIGLNCQAQIGDAKIVSDSISLKKKLYSGKSIAAYYKANQGNDAPSRSEGSVGNGKLHNGKLVPFYGANYTYFDSLSYFEGRAFTHHAVKDIILEAYDSLSRICDNHFYLMELSNREGGRLFPHHTHQNGMSVDFMMPMLKDGKPYAGLDTLGADHYWLKFDNSGQYKDDPSISVDFNLIARHVLLLEGMARKHGFKIAKLIVKIEYKDELFATEYGKLLKASGIYVVQKLTPMVNELHDEHFHIDFAEL